MPRIKLHLFGSFYITLDDQPLTKFRSDKVRALLAYLVLEAKRPIWRTLLAELLWDGYTSKTARHSLRMALLNLRQLFADFEDLLIIDRQTVQLKSSHPDFWCDLLEFEKLDDSSEQHAHLSLTRCLICRESLQAAKSLYEGNFLRGFVIEDSLPFEAWRQAEQERYKKQHEKLLRILDSPLALPPDNLPRQITPFVGRQKEVAVIRHKILDSSYPLVTLVGEGGIGKTRLALAVAEEVKNSFVDGVWFVALGGISSPNKTDANFIPWLYNTLAATISKVLNIPYHSQDSPTTHLFHYLRDKQLLLILDNFEHLIDGAHFIWKLLQKAHYVKVLITSRQRLNIQAEYAFRVDGLPFPVPSSERAYHLFEDSQVVDTTARAAKRTDETTEETEQANSPETYSSIQLFIERADRTLPGFTLQQNNQHAVMQICQFVEGLPMGIELAAALVEHQSVTEIARSLQMACIDTLTTSMSDLPARHRSIRAVFEYSWQLLSEREATILAPCSVFESGFTEEAAMMVTQTTQKSLKTLVDHSLLREILINNVTKRYEFHELVKQFVGEKIDAHKKQEVEERHSLYYLSFMANELTTLTDTMSESDLNELRYEVDNIRQAWQWAVQQARFDLVEQSLQGITLFYCLLNLFEEGGHEFEKVKKQVESKIEDLSIKTRLLRKLKRKQAFLNSKIGPGPHPQPLPG